MLSKNEGREKKRKRVVKERKAWRGEGKEVGRKGENSFPVLAMNA